MIKNLSHHDSFYNPYHLLTNQFLQEDMLFEKTIQQDETKKVGYWIPACDIKENTDSFVLYVEIPQVDPQSIELSVENKMLTIQGQPQLNSESNGADFKLIERPYGRFKRQFILPETADVEKITASSQWGDLKITIKKQAKAQPRKIDVELMN